MAVIPFPAGMTTVTVTGTLSSLGKSRSGSVRVYAERKFGYTGTDWIMDEVSEPVPLVRGKFAVTVPHSPQFGLIGDNGAPLTVGIGYKIVFQPEQSVAAEVLAWTLLPQTVGTAIPGQGGNTTVAFSKLANLGGWPNALTTGPIVTPPPTDTSGSLVQVSPGVFRKV